MEPTLGFRGVSGKKETIKLNYKFYKLQKITSSSQFQVQTDDLDKTSTSSHQMRTWSDSASWKTPEVLEELLPLTRIMEFGRQKCPQSPFQPLSFVPCFSNSGFTQSDGIHRAGGRGFQRFVILGCRSWSIPVFTDMGVVLR